MEKTRNYDMFKFLDNNRDKSKGLDKEHLRRLISSIQARNMLDLRPICVTENMEVLDGQHRLIAAKHLGLEIYYVVKKNSVPEDVILMNICKPWNTTDYLNFYCKEGNKEYIKLKEFCIKHQISISCAVKLMCGKKFSNSLKFREGLFVFNLDEDGYIKTCFESLGIIEKNIGKKQFLKTSKFWFAMKRLFCDEKFDEIHWKRNLERMADKVSARVNTASYAELLLDIYNWRCHNKISFREW